MIKIIKFLSEKVVIVETMLIILYLVSNFFGISIPYVTDFISVALRFLTPISIACLVIYIITSILDHKFIKILLAVFLIVMVYLYFIKR